MYETLSEQDRRGNPLDLLEEFMNAHGWPYERANDSELLVEVEGRWCDYTLCFLWHPEAAALLFTCHFDHKVPFAKRSAVCELLAAVNETLWLGHFDVAGDENVPIFRHSLPLRGQSSASVEQLEDLVDTALAECERFYPALQLVVWAGRPVTEAVQLTVMEPAGEA